MPSNKANFILYLPVLFTLSWTTPSWSLPSQSPGSDCEPLLKGATISIARETTIYDNQQISKKLDRILGQGESAKHDYATVIRLYEEMIQKGGNRFIVSPPAAEALDVLLEHAPNFHEVIEEFKNEAAMYEKSSRPVAFTPSLFLGNPGVGKTHFARLFAQVLGTGFHVIPFSSQTAGWILSGASSQWKGSKVGKVAEHLVYGHYANPVYVLDEVDKASKTREYDPLGPLYTLLEEETAQNFTDEFADVSINASHVIYVATANRLEDIPEPIQDRMNIYYIQAPNRDQVRKIAQTIYKNQMSRLQLPGFSPLLSDDTLDLLTNYPPRTMVKAIKSAIGRAIIANRDHIAVEDLIIKTSADHKNPIGFVQ